MRRVTAVLLAAGASTRMGGAFKQLLPYKGRTIVEACVETILASGVDDAVVVVGHRADEVADAVSRFPVRVVRNDAYRDGMSTSVKAGGAAGGGGGAPGGGRFGG